MFSYPRSFSEEVGTLVNTGYGMQIAIMYSTFLWEVSAEPQQLVVLDTGTICSARLVSADMNTFCKSIL